MEGDAAAIPGDLVRQLVADKEEEITALLGQLEVALREADAAERHLAGHPSVSLLGELPDVADRVAPIPKQDRPRTTVVSRPPVDQLGIRSSATSTAKSPSHGSATAGQREDAGRWSRLATSHLVLKAGIVITIVALALLKFG
jgi:hypothetical protein